MDSVVERRDAHATCASNDARMTIGTRGIRSGDVTTRRGRVVLYNGAIARRGRDPGLRRRRGGGIRGAGTRGGNLRAESFFARARVFELLDEG